MLQVNTHNWCQVQENVNDQDTIVLSFLSAGFKFSKPIMRCSKEKPQQIHLFFFRHSIDDHPKMMVY